MVFEGEARSIFGAENLFFFSVDTPEAEPDDF